MRENIKKKTLIFFAQFKKNLSIFEKPGKARIKAIFCYGSKYKNGFINWWRCICWLFVIVAKRKRNRRRCFSITKRH